MSRFRGYPRNKSILQGIAFALVMGGTFAYAPIVAAQSTISEEYDFDISSQDLANSLSTFGIQSCLQVSAHGAGQNNKVFHHTGNNLIDLSLLKAVRVDPAIAPADIGPRVLAGRIVYETVDVDDVLEEGESYNTNSENYINGGA